MPKLDKKLQKVIKDKYYPKKKKKPVVQTKDNNKVIDFDNPNWESELNIGILVAKIRATKVLQR